MYINYTGEISNQPAREYCVRFDLQLTKLTLLRCLAVKTIPRGADVEIECVAVCQGDKIQ